MDRVIYSVRKAFTIVTDMVDMGFEFLEEKVYRNKYSQGPSEDPVSIAVAVKDAKRMTEEVWGGKSNGICTGFKGLDFMTGGFKKGEVTVMAGRPSMGKTAFVVSILEHVGVKNKIPCALFTLEESKEQVAQRMICSLGEINAHKVRTGFLSKEEWSQFIAAGDKLAESPIYVDDTQALSPVELKRKARKLKTEHAIQFVVLDYIQCTAGVPYNWENDHKMTAFARLLKELAWDLDITVLVLSQMPRTVEERDEHRPYLSDLGEYGDMVNMVDRVLLLFREEYYEPTETNRGQAEILLAKQRWGPVGRVRVKFMPAYSKFIDLVNYEESNEVEV